MTEAEWQLYLPDRPYRATCDEYDAPYEPQAGGDAPSPTRPPSAADDDPAAPPEGDLPGDGSAGGPPDEEEPTGGDPFADVDLANATYDLGCFVEEETLVDGQATDSFGSILELTGDSRRDVNDDGVDDAVLEFTCTTLASLTDITVVLDGSRPAQMEVLDRTSRLR